MNLARRDESCTLDKHGTGVMQALSGVLRIDRVERTRVGVACLDWRMSTCKSEPVVTKAPRTSLRRIVQPARIAPLDHDRTDQPLESPRGFCHPIRSSMYPPR